MDIKNLKDNVLLSLYHTENDMDNHNRIVKELEDRGYRYTQSDLCQFVYTWKKVY